MYPINVVEKETNISKYLLRMWERRYTFPRPNRDAKGERVYTNEDVEKLKLVKKLMEEGYRPSKIINQSLNALKELSKSFIGKSQAVDQSFVIVVASEDLVVDLQNALKNHKVKGVVYINGPDDIANLSL